MTRSLVVATLVLSALAPLATSAGQTNATVGPLRTYVWLSVRLLDAKGNPIPDVSLTVTNEKTGETGNLATGKDGRTSRFPAPRTATLSISQKTEPPVKKPGTTVKVDQSGEITMRGTVLTAGGPQNGPTGSPKAPLGPGEPVIDLKYTGLERRPAENPRGDAGDPAPVRTDVVDFWHAPPQSPGGSRKD